jgi:hypothetical protein
VYAFPGVTGYAELYITPPPPPPPPTWNPPPPPPPTTNTSISVTPAGAVQEVVPTLVKLVDVVLTVGRLAAVPTGNVILPVSVIVILCNVAISLNTL